MSRMILSHYFLVKFFTQRILHLEGGGGAGGKPIITVPGTEFYELKLRRGRPVKI